MLLITTDQQRWDALGVHGHPVLQTPALDAIARTGIDYRNSFCAATACMPSRASLLTGVLPDRHGVKHTGADHWIDPNLPTLPSLLSRGGYRTVAVGKMHFVPWDAPCGFDRRIIIESKYANCPDAYRRHIAKRGLQSRVVGHRTPGFATALKGMPSTLDEDDHIDAYIGRRGLETINALAADRQQPFFMWLSFCGPHDPYDPPQPYASMYTADAMPAPIRAPGELDRVPPIAKRNATCFGKDQLTLHGLSDAELRRLRALYCGNVTLIDKWIGHVIEALGAHQIDKNTLVIFTSDHGDCLGDHDLLWKGWLPCDADMRVPLLLRWPGYFEPGTSDDFATGIDVMPTILAATGVDGPSDGRGTNLLDVIDGRQAARDRAIMFAEPDKWHYRDARWAYTWWPNEPFDTLYDLRDDPHELNNLCFGRSLPSQASELRGRIQKQRECC